MSIYNQADECTDRECLQPQRQPLRQQQLPPEGQRILSLLSEAQNELTRLESRKALLQAAQKQLIGQLKPLLPPPVTTNRLEANKCWVTPPRKSPPRL